MSLATSCPSCGTIFKVVEDQLKVSEGWVRCGHCHEVFNALEGLFDLAGRQRPHDATRPSATSDAPPRRSVGTAPPGPATPPSRAGHHRPESPADWIETRPAMFSDVAALRTQQLEREAARLSRLAAQGGAIGATEAAELLGDLPPVGRTASPLPAARAEPPPAAPPAATGPAIEFATPDEPDPIEVQADLTDAYAQTEFIDLGAADTIFQPHEHHTHFDEHPDAGDPLPPVDDTADARGLGNWRAEVPAERPPTTALVVSPVAAAGTPHVAAMPAFVRQADRAAWWRKPGVRWLLALCCVLAAAALLLQLALHNRDSLAVRWPPTRAPLTALCQEFGCRLQAPRQLDALVVENTALTRPAGVDGYRLQVLLRNRVDFAILAPHLELSLTDSSGAVIVRRVLSPADFRQEATLNASAEGNWQLELSSSDKRIAGYTVAAFYP